MLKVKIIKTSHTYNGTDYVNSHAKYKTFRSCEDLLEYMKKTYNLWVVEFEPERRESEKPFDLLIELYDRYRE